MKERVCGAATVSGLVARDLSRRCIRGQIGAAQRPKDELWKISVQLKLVLLLSSQSFKAESNFLVPVSTISLSGS